MVLDNSLVHSFACGCPWRNCPFPFVYSCLLCCLKKKKKVLLSFSLMNKIVFTFPSLVFSSGYLPIPTFIGRCYCRCTSVLLPPSLMWLLVFWPVCGIQVAVSPASRWDLCWREQDFFASFFSPSQAHLFPFPLGGSGGPDGWILETGCLTLSPALSLFFLTSVDLLFPLHWSLPHSTATALLLLAFLTEWVCVTFALHSCFGT